MCKKNNTTQIKKANNNNNSSEKKISDPRIIRSPHDRQNPYVMTNKNLLFDESLSPLCRFFLTQLLSKPDNWDFRTSALIKEIPWLNEKKVHKFWRESIAIGYVKRVDIFEKGRRIDCIYYVAENPIYLEDSNNFARDSQKRSCENGSDLISNVYLLSKKDNTEKTTTQNPVMKKKTTPPPSAIKKTAPLSPIIPLFGYEWRNPKTKSLERIENGLTKEEFDKLTELIGESAIRAVCNNMKKYADDNKGTVRFKNKNLFKKILEWNRKSSAKKTEKDQKKKEESLRKGEETVEDVSYEIDEKRRKDFADYIKTIKEKPANRMICDLIIPNGGCTRAELRHAPGNLSVDSIKYDDPTYRDKMKKWMQEIAEELRSLS